MQHKTIVCILLISLIGLTPAAFVLAQNVTSTQDIQNLRVLIQQLQDQIKQMQTQISSLTAQLQEVKAELTFTKTLIKGTKGDEVKELQSFLKQFPDIYPEGLVTGYFGPLTEAATKRFQEKEGIIPTGVVDTQTITRLNEFSAIPAMPATPAVSAIPAQPATGNATTTQAVPATPAMPAIPATPAVPAQPATPSINTTAPVISNVSASTTATTAYVRWTTNEPADSQVGYGLYGYDNTTYYPAYVTSHSILLSGLDPYATYHYQVKSKDAAGNMATSGDYTFTTPFGPTAGTSGQTTTTATSGTSAQTASTTTTVTPSSSTATSTTITATSGDTTSPTTAAASSEHNSTISIERLFPGQYDNTRYNIILNDPEGIAEISLNYADGRSLWRYIWSGGPNCHYGSWGSGSVYLYPSDFPVQGWIIDCVNTGMQYPLQASMPSVSSLPSYRNLASVLNSLSGIMETLQKLLK